MTISQNKSVKKWLLQSKLIFKINFKRKNNNIKNQLNKIKQNRKIKLNKRILHKLFNNHQNLYLLNQISNHLLINQLRKFNLIRSVCNAIAVNKDCSILVAGCDKQIKVFEFTQEILKQVQILNELGNYVCTLNFMKRSDHFISGSQDNSIIIWAKNQNNSWICQQKLNGHTSYIYCLLLNNNEDIIVSGSYDNKIKFWYNQNGWLCSQTITDHTNPVWGLSFNEQQNKLISCGHDKSILVIEQPELNKQWIVIQKIIVEQFGHNYALLIIIHSHSIFTVVTTQMFLR
ncbi:unnamed protein product [Paramecium pentaurelia]|uniref:Uncharacterized protein n=1 Tax=Paramecium pentaurelia TaxID=43138 RepID=A0A8S1Y7Y9_9CILI|nr:unnamed protein product [Paramecium pentaurelia]